METKVRSRQDQINYQYAQYYLGGYLCTAEEIVRDLPSLPAAFGTVGRTIEAVGPHRRDHSESISVISISDDDFSSSSNDEEEEEMADETVSEPEPTWDSAADCYAWEVEHAQQQLSAELVENAALLLRCVRHQ